MLCLSLFISCFCVTHATVRSMGWCMGTIFGLKIQSACVIMAGCFFLVFFVLLFYFRKKQCLQITKGWLSFAPSVGSVLRSTVCFFWKTSMKIWFNQRVAVSPCWKQGIYGPQSNHYFMLVYFFHWETCWYECLWSESSMRKMILAFLFNQYSLKSLLAWLWKICFKWNASAHTRSRMSTMYLWSTRVSNKGQVSVEVPKSAVWQQTPPLKYFID